jgi:excisionase family DNA binding protein
MSIADLATYLDVPVATIYRWRYRRQGPLGYRIGRHVRYRTDDIERWLEAQRDAAT